MAGPFLGINMAAQSLRSFQRALDTTGHNIANVNTRGYSRQTVDFAAMQPLDFYNMGWRTVGQGVNLTSINRIRDQFLDANARVTSGSYGRASTLSSGLQRIDGIYGEPQDAGIANALGKFFDSWSALGSSPSEPAARAQVRQAGQMLADRIRSSYGELVTESSRTTSDIQANFGRIDELAQRIDQLNRDIRRASSTGATPNDLLDQRDLALEDLGRIVNVHREVFSDGSYAVYAAGFTLVDTGGAHAFPRTYDASAGTVTDGSLTFSVRSGELAGNLALLGQINSHRTRLDTLANELRTQINTPHMTGTNAMSQTGIRFFNDVAAPPQTGAIDFDLSADVKASADAIAAGTSGSPGDGGLAQAFSLMRQTQFGALGNRTFQSFFQDMISNLANDAAYHSAAADTERAVLEQISQQQQAVAGVSLDDEMSNMMRFQRSYQAAARALTVFDQVAEDLIGMLRR